MIYTGVRPPNIQLSADMVLEHSEIWEKQLPRKLSTNIVYVKIWMRKLLTVSLFSGLGRNVSTMRQCNIFVFEVSSSNLRHKSTLIRK